MGKSLCFRRFLRVITSLIFGLVIFQLFGCNTIEGRPPFAQIRQNNSIEEHRFGPVISLFYRGRGQQITTVLIESDGARWINGGSQPPSDPTPKDSIALNIFNEMVGKGGAPIVYLGRPCQYTREQNLELCQPSAWGRDRYTSPQADALADALDQVLRKRQLGKQLIIAGHSGGGVMAVRVGYRMKSRGYNVLGIATMAAPLTPDIWTSNHQFDALKLDDLDTELLKLIEQSCVYGWYGDKDLLVTTNDLDPNIRQYLGLNMHTATNVTHRNGWLSLWTTDVLPIMLRSEKGCGTKSDEYSN